MSKMMSQYKLRKANEILGVSPKDLKTFKNLSFQLKNTAKDYIFVVGQTGFLCDQIISPFVIASETVLNVQLYRKMTFRVSVLL